MKATYTQPKKTPIPFPKALECMKWALKSQLGQDPSEDVLALALAKTALETGQWVSIWNSNWGNVKASDSYVGMYTCITLNECLVRNGTLQTIWFAPEGELSGPPSKGGKILGPPIPVPEGHPQTRMRAFANPYDGVDCYVDFVAHGRYQNAWKALLTGNAVAYVHALKLAGYFTAPETDYIKGVSALKTQFLAKMHNLPSIPKVDVEWAKLKELVPTLQFDLRDVIEIPDDVA